MLASAALILVCSIPFTKALELPADGRVVALDTSAEFAAIGRRYWRAAKVDHKIDLRIGPALDSLQRMIEQGEAGSYDLGNTRPSLVFTSRQRLWLTLDLWLGAAFIDADKQNYDNYYEACLKLVRKGGLVLVDNVFWYGRPITGDTSSRTAAIAALNNKIRNDARVAISTVPLADGVTLCRKL